MIVRDAVAADAAALAAVVGPIAESTTATFDATVRDAAWCAALIAARPGAVFVAAEGDAILGLGTFAAFRGGTGYARTMEHTIMLAPEARGRGMGPALLRRIEEAARAADANSLIAAISAENAAGLAFHDRQGFAHAGRLSQAGWKFGRWIDLVLMQKMLHAAP
jgi:phosphinothricin acetyltransferase